jgi:outer membrane protein assembly factor BamB
MIMLRRPLLVCLLPALLLSAALLKADEPFVAIQRISPSRANSTTEPLFEGKPKLVWRHQSESPITSPIFGARDSVFFGHGKRLDNVHTDGHLCELDWKTGKLLSDRQAFSTITFSPFLAYDRLFLLGSRSFETFVSNDASREYAQIYEFKPGDIEFVKGPLLLNCSAPPLVASGHVIVNEGPEIRAIDLLTLEESWRLNGPAEWEKAWLSTTMLSASDEGLLIAGNPSRGLLAVDLGTRQQVWRKDFGKALRPEVCYAEGRLFGTTIDGTLVCFSAKTGEALYEVQLSSPALTGPSVADSKVFIGLEGSKIGAFDTTTGKELWTVDSHGDLTDLPLVAGSNLVFGTRSAFAVCLAVSDGSELWRYMAYAAVTSTPLIFRKHVYFSDEKRVIYCLGAFADPE